MQVCLIFTTTYKIIHKCSFYYIEMQNAYIFNFWTTSKFDMYICSALPRPAFSLHTLLRSNVQHQKNRTAKFWLLLLPTLIFRPFFFLNKETSNNSSIILTATKTHVIGALIQGEDRQVDGVASCCDLMSHWPYSRLSRHPGVGSHSYCSPPRGSTHSSAPYCATLLLQSTTASYNTRRYQQLPATHCLWSLYAWNSTSEPTKLREKTESLLSVCVCCVYEYVCVKWVCICLCVQRAEEMSNI